MKHLIIKNVIGFIKNSAIFSLFSMGLVATLLAVFFLYNINSNINASDPDAQNRYQIATIDLTGFSKEQIQASFEVIKQQRNDIAFAYSIFWDNEHMVAAAHTDRPYLYSGRYFSKTDIDSGNASAILSGSLYEEYHEKSHIIIGGKTYDILAFSDRVFTEVPFTSLPSNIQINSLQLFFKNMLSKSKIQVLGKQLAQSFPGAFVDLPSAPDLKAVSKNLYQSYMSLLIAAVALLNLSFLYRYILKKREKKYGIYRICGCSQLKGFTLYFSEILIITSILFLLASLFFHCVVEQLLPVVNENLSYTLFIEDYLILYVVFLVLVSIIFIPVILRYNRKKPIDFLK